MKNKIIANVINAVLVSFVVTALVCFLLVQFADIPFLPTWDSLFRSNPEFDTVSDSVIFMNVGEGDSTLIRSNGRFVLIDTGDGDAQMLEAGTFRTMLYVFAGIDILWGGALLTSYFRNRRK